MNEAASAAETASGTASSTAMSNCCPTIGTGRSSIPAELYLSPARNSAAAFGDWQRIELRTFEWPPETPGNGAKLCESGAAPRCSIRIDARAEQPAAGLVAHSDGQRPLACCWPRNRRGAGSCCSNVLRGRKASKRRFSTASPSFVASRSNDWALRSPGRCRVCRLETCRRSRSSPKPNCLAIGRDRSASRRRAERDPAKILKELTDLRIGAPVVHESYGVGRYVGLQTMDVAGYTGEFLVLEYADGDKLYVPVHGPASRLAVHRSPGGDRAPAQARRRAMAEGTAQGGTTHS